jgi:hypothetical protein
LPEARCGLSTSILKILLTSSDRSPSAKEHIPAAQVQATSLLNIFLIFVSCLSHTSIPVFAAVAVNATLPLFLPTFLNHTLQPINKYKPCRFMYIIH